ncbi:tyrosine-type recombinase/integrase [Afipia sp. DC4300-2b1]|uniref:tyrosine-type recombinase/integrase n=1 Tax=Afipia sp. DC4300-2b1 TaxID=2804672 RepID=UPI003CEABBED
MVRQINRLTARTVATVKEVGRYADGNGLYLSLSKNGGKRWVFLYRSAGRIREKGLGSAAAVSLKDARLKADEVRKQLSAGLDPINEGRKSQGVMTFAQCAKAYIASHEAGWSNPKHADQWRNTLKTYAEPVIGKVPVNKVDVSHIMNILDPIWRTKTETASRVRGRIESILDWAAVKKYRSSENPARLKGHLDHLLPRRQKVAKVQHHPALPYKDIPAFMADLRTREGTGALALEFTILTAARTNETLGAKWDEIDLESKVWTVPADRMKARVLQAQPLSDRSIEILKSLSTDTEYVFPGNGDNNPMSSMSLLAVLKRMNHSDITTHGFRSTFRDWAAETTEFPNEVVEMALAHTVKNKAEAAYRRGNMLDRRRVLMDAWSDYCSQPVGSPDD